MSTREPCYSSDMQQGAGAAPQTMKEPKQARADMGGRLACMHLCALLNMQGDTSRPLATPQAASSLSLHRV